ncbi:AAA-like domain-containing protein, partial [Candidatus Poribacteria bacterium]|nr:AAA-like domain-containing protein [Candidatus Poribacteria bacterium]
MRLLRKMLEGLLDLLVQWKLNRLEDLSESIKVSQKEGENRYVILQHFGRFLTAYKKGTMIGEKVRKRVDLVSFSSEVAETNRADVLKQLTSISQHDCPDVRNEAKKARKKILDDLCTSIKAHQEKGEYTAIPNLFEDFLIAYREETAIDDDNLRKQLSKFLFEVARTNRKDVLRGLINIFDDSLSFSQHDTADKRMEAEKTDVRKKAAEDLEIILDDLRKTIQAHQEKGECEDIPNLLEDFLTAYQEAVAVEDKLKKQLDGWTAAIKEQPGKKEYKDIRDKRLTAHQEAVAVSDKLRKQFPGFLFEVAKTNREEVVMQLISLSQHNRTTARMEAVKALKMILEADSNTAIQSIRFLITHRCLPETFLHFSKIPGTTLITRLCEGYYHLLKDGKGGLKAAVDLFEETQGIKHGRELFLIYKSLYHLSEAKAIDDIIAIEPYMVEILGYDDVIHLEVLEIFKRLWEIIGYLSVYERVELGNKVPYLAAPLMILTDIGNTIERSKNKTELELQIINAIVPNLQNIFIREFERLKGRADLELDLKPKEPLFADEVTLLLTVRNRGNAVAENINLRLVPQNEERFSISGSGEDTIATLSPQREARVEFTIKPHEAGRLRIPFEIEYSDLEKSGKKQQFADLVEVSHTLEKKVAQSTGEFYNPYIVGLPVSGEMFFGREEVFQFIRQRLSGHAQKAIIVLRGQRRTGKTSVLRQLEHRLDEKYIPVFLDMQGFTDARMNHFLYRIGYLIVSELEERGISIEQPRQEQFSAAPGVFFRDVFLNQILDKIEYRHLLLLFDEFEELEQRVKDGKLDRDIFPFLRNLMQHTERMDFIFAGTHRLQEMTQDYWSILFNIAVYQDISFMKREEAEALIRNPVKDVMYYDDLAVDKIIRATAGHPYFVQLLCSSLTDYYIKTKKYYITLQDVNRILNDVLQGGVVHFDFIWQ